MKVIVNDEAVELDGPTTVDGLLTRLGFPDKGIAVAVDMSLLRRACWEELALDLRYRAVLFFPLTGVQDFSDARVSHGINLGLSLRL